MKALKPTESNGKFLDDAITKRRSIQMRTLKRIGIQILAATVSTAPEILCAQLNVTASAPADTPYSVVDRSGNARVYQRITYEPGPSGEWFPHTNSYTELGTGLCYQQDGQWVDSVEEIDPVLNGGAEAIQGQHQVYFPYDIYDGVIEVVTPDGEQLKSRPLGISYFDGTNSVLISELTNSAGQISGNQVLYSNAFTDISANLLCTYRKDGFECDLVFHSQLPPPETFGMDSKYARLELLTEFFNSPDPVETPGITDAADGLADDSLTFGTMTIGQGNAFVVNSNGSENAYSVAEEQLPVYKTWAHIDGRTFLIEEAPFPQVQPLLSGLPPVIAAASATDPIIHKVSSSRLFPAKRLAKTSTNTLHVAEVPSNARHGLVWDYNMINTSQTNFTFKGDTTYFVTASVTIVGTATFEGGAVIKFNTNSGTSPTLNLDSVNCLTGPYRPAVFTGRDDDSYGEPVSNSTGTPSGVYAFAPLQINHTGNILLHDLRILYATEGIKLAGTGTHTVRDVQILHCTQFGIFDSSGSPVILENSLIAGIGGGGNGVAVGAGQSIWMNVTVDSCTTAAQGLGFNVNFYITNSIMANITNSLIIGGAGTPQLNGTPNGFYKTPGAFGSSPHTNTSSPFQIAGAGSYYLASSCTFTNGATTNIDSTLLNEFGYKTVFPPTVFSNNTFTVSTNFGPQVQRDGSTLALGYHYDPLDWCFGGVTANSNLAFSAGTAVGYFETVSTNGFGIDLANNSTNTFSGTVTAPCVFARYSSVQEGNGNWKNKGAFGGISTVSNSAYYAEIDGQFVHCYALAGDPNHFRDNAAKLDVYANHSEFNSGSLAGYNLGLFMTNCLFDRLGQIGSQQNSDGLCWRNCTVYGGQVLSLHATTNLDWKVWIENCAFDGSTNNMDDNSGGLTNITYCNYNAFLNGAQRLIVQGSNDVVTNTFGWQPGALGDFYQSPNSPLIDMGSVSATNVGLYHFTTLTNEVPETNSIVDIGYHYVALNSSGQPDDTDGDGVPDYIEDANGNGSVDSGESSWLLGIDFQPQSTNVVQGATNIIFSVVAGGSTPFSYQWQFNGTAITDGTAISGATSSNLTLLVVTNGNEGSYSVVVTNSTGSVTSSPAVLTVNDPLVISNSPSSVTNVQGGTNSFGVIVGGHHGVFQWYGPGGALTDGSGGISGATTTNVTISNLAGSDAGYYYIVATNLFNCITSVPAQLVVITNPDLLTPPNNLTNIQADDVTITDRVSGVDLFYQWSLITNSVTNAIPGATNAFYTKLVVQTNDAGSYEVVITNIAGSTNAIGSLTVLVPPWFTNQPPLNVAALGGNNVTFGVATAFGTPNLSYQWFDFGTNAIPNATNSMLTLNSVTTNDASGYFLVVSNIAGTNRSAWTWLTVTTNGVAYRGWGSGTRPTSSNAVSMISPANTNSMNPAIYVAPTNISIHASAVSQYDSITNVFFYSSTNLGAATNFALFTNLPGPALQGTNVTFGYAWTNAAHGTNLLLAIACDDKGLNVTSAPVYVVMDWPPTNSAGADQTLEWPTNITSTNLTMAGVVTDDGLPFGVTNVLWMPTSGVTFSNAVQTNTIAAFNNYGTYTLQLRADDSFVTNYSTCTINLERPPNVSFTSPSTNPFILVSNRSIALSASAQGFTAGISDVSFYDGATWLGSGTPTPSGNYNLPWTSDQLGNHTLSVVATDYDPLGLSSTSAVTVIVVPPLTATITSPTNTQLFVDTPTNIILTALITNYASAPVTNVSFSNQLMNLGSATNVSGYLWQLSTWDATNGVFSITVVAHDSSGNSATNSITITNNAMPMVTITNPVTNPTNPASFWQGENVTNGGLATDADIDGKVTNVTLCRFGTNICSINFSPGTNYALFSFVWTNSDVGTYPITAVATDNRGASSVSGICLFKVESTNRPPSVAITYPTNGAVFPPGSDITITASAATTNYLASVTNVEFFVNGADIGGDIAAPYSITRCCWTPGTYVLQVTATDSTGAWNVSTNVTITIVSNQPAYGGQWDTWFAQQGVELTDWSGSIGTSPGAFGPVSLGKGANGLFAIMSFYDVIATTDETNWTDLDNPYVYIPAEVGGWYNIFVEGTNVYASGDPLDYYGTDIPTWGQYHVYKWNWNIGHWDPVGNGLNYSGGTGGTEVEAMAEINGDLYVGGYFVSAGITNEDTNVQFIAKLDTVSNIWIPVGNGLSNAVYAIAAIGNDIYAGGVFTNAGGNTNANYIARLINGAWTNVGDGLNLSPEYSDLVFGTGYFRQAPVHTIVACGSNLFVGGQFASAGSDTNAHGIAIWNVDTGWRTLNGGPGQEWLSSVWSTSNQYDVSTLAVHGDRIFIGGGFTNVYDGDTSIPANFVASAQWNEANQRWEWSDMDQGIAPTYNGPPISSTIINGSDANKYDVYFLGYFTTIGSDQIPCGTDIGGFARWRVGYPGPTNAPQVSITSPSSPTIITNTGPATTVYLVGQATSSYTNIQTANFYHNGVSIGSQINSSSETSPYGFTNEWDDPSPGLYLINASATDDTGLMGESSTLVINVKSSTNPVVAVDDQYTILQGTLTATLHVLTNDSSPSGLVITNVTRLHNNLGTVAISPDRTYLTYNPLPNVFGTDIFYYTVTDTNGNSDSASVTVNIVQPPTVSITNPTFEPYTANASSTIAISASSRDWSGVITNTAIYVNGVLIGQNPTNTASTNWSTTTAGYYALTATAVDGSGFANTSAPVTVIITNSSTATNVIMAHIDNLTGTPTALGPLKYPIVTSGLFDLVGTASDSHSGELVSYQVLVHPFGDESTVLANVTPPPLDPMGFHELSTNGGVTGGDLGTNDFSTLANGMYDLELIVRGGAGEANCTNSFELQSDLKIGQFSFSEQDLTLPVNGIPLTVTRTYNSLNPDPGPFGTSWNFALNDMDVQLDDVRQPETVDDNSVFSDDGNTDGTGNAVPQVVNMRVDGNWDVTLTMPDGRRVTFQASNDGSTPNYSFSWSAPTGVHATLEPLVGNLNPVVGSANLQWGPDNVSGLVWADEDAAQGPQPYQYSDIAGWVLTTQNDGTKYYITRGSPNYVACPDPADQSKEISARVYGPPKLTMIKPVSGDSIVITNTGVFHYDPSGNLTRAILFDHDSQGRITALHDPNGGSNGLPAVRYIYDNDNNNLIQVLKLVDRNNGIYTTNKYDYNNPNFPHYITSIENGDGIPVARNFYDDSGRLIAVQDANGTTTYFNHSTTNNTDIIVDRLGNTNSYVYDLQGNVIWQTNALGQVTASTYGDANNPTLETAVTNAYGTAVATWALYAYDSDGNPTNVVSMGHTNSSAYNGNGNLVSQIDPLGNVTSNLYDEMGNLTNTTLYDANNNPINQSSPVYTNGYLAKTLNANSQVTGTFVYDNSGNLTNTTDANGFTRSFAYDANGNQTNSSYQWTPPEGGSSTNVTTSTYYDAQNRVTQTVDELGNTSSIFYNSAGNVAYTIDKFGNTNSMLYDALGRLIQTTYPNNTFTRTAYDAAGRAYLTTDRNGTSPAPGTMTLYDAQGRVTNLVRLTNVVVNIVYNGSVAESMSNMATGAVSTNSTVYDAAGRVVSRTNPDGTTSYDYYPDGQVMHVTDPLTNITFYTYDAADRPINLVDALTNSTKFQYDAVGRTIATLYNDNSYVSNVFNNLGQRIQVIDQATNLTQFGYSLSGQLTNVIKPCVPDPEHSDTLTPPTWSYIYNTNGNQIATVDPKGRATTNVFDAFSRQFSQRLPIGQTNLALYNSLGQLRTNYDFSGQRTELRYDQFGQLTNTYDFVQGQTHPSNAVSYAYDQLGRVTNIIQLYGTNAADSYAMNDGPTDKFFAGRERHFLRAALMSITTTAPKWGGSLVALVAFCAVFILVPSGRKLRQILARYYLCGGWKLLPKPRFGEKRISPYKLAKWMPSYFWRAVSVVTIIVFVADDLSWNQVFAQCSPPASNNLANCTSNTRITSYTYDFDGHMTQMNSPEGYINYLYSSATGRLTNTCTEYSSIGYGYDALGRLQTVCVTERNGLPTNELTTYHYDKVGNCAEVDLPNSVITQYHYDSLNRLTNMTHQLGSTNLASYSYTLNASGRRTDAVEILRIPDAEGGGYLTNNLSWQFDGMYRLTSEVNLCSVSSASYTNSYIYDLVGNRLKLTQSAGNMLITTNLYDINDELLREVVQANGLFIGTNNYAYDSNGSIIGMTNIASTLSTTVYTYDLMNKLSTVATNGTVLNTYQYNDQGIRVRTMGAIGTNYYLIDANNQTGYQQVLEESSTLGGTPAMSYVIGNDILAQASSGSASYLLADGHGSTRQMFSSAGGVTSRYNFDAYGNIQPTSTGNPETSKLYCGEQYDSTLQMYNLRARYYSPINGRFNQRDIFNGYNEDPQSLHKYDYCQGDAVNGMDPTGRDLISLACGSAIAVSLDAFYNTSVVAVGFGLRNTILGVESGYSVKQMLIGYAGDWINLAMIYENLGLAADVVDLATESGIFEAILAGEKPGVAYVRCQLMAAILNDYWEHSGGIAISDAEKIVKASGFNFEIGYASRFEPARNAVIIAAKDLKNQLVNRILLAEEMQHGLSKLTAEADAAILRAAGNERYHAIVFQRILDAYQKGAFAFLTPQDVSAITTIMTKLQQWL